MGRTRKTIGFRINRETIRKAIVALNGVSQVAVTLMMLLTATDVILRYIFNSPIIFAQEVTELLLVVLVSLGLSYCAIGKEHVNVDVLAGKLSKRWLAIFDCFTGLITLGFFLLIVWRSFVYMGGLAEGRFTSLVLYIPIFPFVGLIGVGFGLFTIVILMDLTDSILGVFEK